MLGVEQDAVSVVFLGGSEADGCGMCSRALFFFGSEQITDMVSTLLFSTLPSPILRLTYADNSHRGSKHSCPGHIAAH